MTFRLDVARRPGAVVVSPEGDLDVRSSDELRDALREVAGDGSTDTVVLDLAGSDFLDSSALGAVVGAAKQLEAAGRRLAVVTDKPHLLKVLRITRLNEVVEVGERIEDVLPRG